MFWLAVRPNTIENTAARNTVIPALHKGKMRAKENTAEGSAIGKYSSIRLEPDMKNPKRLSKISHGQHSFGGAVLCSAPLAPTCSRWVTEGAV